MDQLPSDHDAFQMTPFTLAVRAYAIDEFCLSTFVGVMATGRDKNTFIMMRTFRHATATLPMPTSDAKVVELQEANTEIQYNDDFEFGMSVLEQLTGEGKRKVRATFVGNACTDWMDSLKLNKTTNSFLKELQIQEYWNKRKTIHPPYTWEDVDFRCVLQWLHLLVSDIFCVTWRYAYCTEEHRFS